MEPQDDDPAVMIHRPSGVAVPIPLNFLDNMSLSEWTIGKIGAFSKLPSKRLLEMIAVNLCSPFPSDPCSVFINRRIESNVSYASPPLTLLVLQFNNCNLSQLDPIYSAKGRLWISRQRSPTLLPSRRNLFRTSSARGARTLPPARFRGPLCSGRKKRCPVSTIDDR